MLIQYRATGHRRDVADSIGARLIASRIAYPAYEAAAMESEEISLRTGKPKRKYKRRDMVAEG